MCVCVSTSVSAMCAHLPACECLCIYVCVTVLPKCTISRRGLTVSMTRFKHRCHNYRTLGGDLQLNYSQPRSGHWEVHEFSCLVGLGEGLDEDIQREILFALARLVQSLIVLLC